MKKIILIGRLVKKDVKLLGGELERKSYGVWIGREGWRMGMKWDGPERPFKYGVYLLPI